MTVKNLSRFGNIVVVTVNHRLNILGYLDLSPYGEKYANSGTRATPTWCGSSVGA